MPGQCGQRHLCLFSGTCATGSPTDPGPTGWCQRVPWYKRYIFNNKVFISSFSAGLCSAEKYVRKKKIIGKTILILHCSKFQFTITNTEYLHSLKPIFYFYSFKYIEVTFLQITYRSKHLSYFLFNLGKLRTLSTCQQNLDPKNTPSSFPSDTKITSVLVQILNCVKHLHLGIE